MIDKKQLQQNCILSIAYFKTVITGIYIQYYKTSTT